MRALKVGAYQGAHRFVNRWVVPALSHVEPFSKHRPVDERAPRASRRRGGREEYAHLPAGTIGGPVAAMSRLAVLITLRVEWYQSFNEISIG